MSTEEILIKTTNSDNPGQGNCAFYAFAKGLINIIQEEKKIGKRQLFDRWISDKTLNEDNYDDICQFDLYATSLSAVNNELLDSLQQSLRLKALYFKQEELESICNQIRGDQFEENYTKLFDNSIMSQFVSLYSNRQSSEFNIFNGSERILDDFDVLEVEIASLRIDEPTSDQLNNFFKNRDDGIGKTDDDKIKIYLGVQRQFETRKKLAELFLELYTTRNESNISPIIECMQKITEDFRWGNDHDLRALAKAFEVNLEIYENDVLQQSESPKDDWYTVSLNNHHNIHWTTRIKTATINSTLPDDEIRRLKKGIITHSDTVTSPDSPESIEPAPLDPIQQKNTAPSDRTNIDETPRGISEEPIPEERDIVKPTLTLEHLKELVNSVSDQYQGHSKTFWTRLSIFNRHGGTGRARVKGFVDEFNQFQSVEAQLTAIKEYLSDTSKGNTNPHSFRTMLLTTLLNQQAPKGTKELSFYDVCNKYNDHLKAFKNANNSNQNDNSEINPTSKSS